MSEERERVPLLWSTVRETASARGFCCSMGIRIIRMCAEERIAWKGCTQREGHRDWQEMSQRRSCDRQLTFCRQF